MPPDHQRNAGGRGLGSSHVCHSATASGTGPNRPIFALTVSKTQLWKTGEMTVQPQARPFGIYVHVPFCATRCGYCDFNTYTPAELGGANPDGWLEALRIELELAAAELASRGPLADVSTVFVGGGTPSMLGGERLASVLDAVRANFALAADAEVTTEANPESTSPEL